MTALCVLAAIVPGCALVEQEGTDGTKRRTIALLSPVNVISTPSGQMRHVRLTGIGVAVSGQASGFGYFSTSEFILDPRCQIVLIDNTDEQLERFAELVPNAGNLCDEPEPKRGSHVPRL